MELPEQTKVFIVLVNWNGRDDTIECLYSLESLKYSNFSIIIVDNGSTDDSIKEIKKRFNGITLLENKKNEGFAAGNNRGIKYALEREADYVWLLNNDTVVDENALTALLNRVQNNPEIGMCGSKLIYYNKRNVFQLLAGGRYNKWLGITQNIGQNKPIHYSFDRKNVERQLQFIAGASLLVSRPFIEEIGLLCEDYFLYFEEIDWSKRAEGKFNLGFAAESIVYHKEGASTGGHQLRQDEKSKTADYYQLKNRLKFSYKYFPFYLPLVYLTVIYAIFNRMRRGKWHRIPMIIKLMFTFNK